MLAKQIAELLRQCSVNTFATAQGDNGISYMQVLCPDGTGLTAAMDDSGAVQVHYCGSQNAENDKGLLAMDDIFVEAGILDENHNPI